jgi:adenylosuccinate lyase
MAVDSVLNNTKMAETMATIKLFFEESTRCNLAFWLGVWRGEAGRAKAIPQADINNPDTVGEQFAFELGLQLRPVWNQIAKEVTAALIAAAVAAILGGIGVKPK